MITYVTKAGAVDAPYPEVKAIQFRQGMKELAGVTITKVEAKKPENSYWRFPGHRGGNHGVEILNEGDFILKASASIFAMEQKPFKAMYKLKQKTK